MDNFWEYLQNLTDAQSIISIGFFFLLIVVFAETGLFFGFFLPGDYLLFMAGLLCSTGKFDISIYTLVLSLIGAGVLGNYTGYWFGYRTGPALFKKNNSLFFKKQYIEIAEEFYAKHGGKALVLGRFFPIIRTFAPIFAGVVKVDLKKFTLYNFIGRIFFRKEISAIKRLYGVYCFRIDLSYKRPTYCSFYKTENAERCKC